MTSFLSEIRGMHFRLSDPINPSPAKLLVERIRGDGPLQLVREPQNAHDANAIQVWIEPKAVLSPGDLSEGSEFEAKLAGFGWSLEAVRDTPELMLGYIAKEDAAALAPFLDAGHDYEAKFAVTAKGKPAAKISFEEKE